MPRNCIPTEESTVTGARIRAVFASGLLAVAGFSLGGCSGSVSLDLSADAPADPQIAGINVDVLGVEFERSDGGTEKLEFTAGEPADLITLLEGGSFALFTNEELPDGTYTGVRLLLDDDDATVVLSNGRELPAQLAAGTFAPVDFTIEEDETSSHELLLTLDLRRSLSFDDANDEYTLTPILRAVATGDAGQISGTVSTGCPAGTSLQTGGAVYLFAGEDIEPDDIDAADPEPYATTAVVSGFGTSYALRALPPGDYTMALTCNGNDDAPSGSDDIRFQRTVNISVDGDSITHNFN